MQSVDKNQKGIFIISLDCEMLWGMRDHETKDTYGSAVCKGHKAMVDVLALFEKYGIHATWGFVGLCVLDSLKAIRKYVPVIKPTYDNPALSNYCYIENDYSDNDLPDPYYYSGDMIPKILQVPGQEIGSHSFSHYYCSERGQNVEQFGYDIESSVNVLKDYSGNKPRSFIFPRNQAENNYIRVLEECGFSAYRGEQQYYNKKKTIKGMLDRVLFRFVPYFAKKACYSIPLDDEKGIKNIPLSCHIQFYRGGSVFLHKLQIFTLKRTMTYCAKKHMVFHMGFHPHNLGVCTETNLHSLEELLRHFEKLRERYGFDSLNMYEAANVIKGA